MLQALLPARAFAAAQALVLSVGAGFMGIAVFLILGYVSVSPTFGWTGALPVSYNATPS